MFRVMAWAKASTNVRVRVMVSFSVRTGSESRASVSFRL